MNTGYSYTVIRVQPDVETHIGVSIYPDALAEVKYFPAKDNSHAFINITHGVADVTIGTTNNAEITNEHITFARQLLDAAAAFLADCERLHAEQQAAA
ncbi:hypothetical protein [Nonomuraea jabiensis]|uniref:Uncharacterized protein n=1 Tax=Nonomuraea jabiensis TaxID=882448 RepID=A0A7W9LAK4_9ACTN|nr:hypothetical protein [Nonomuraea jabiensis]MBB5776772.1 hypothetical protein [Nonomuraea jabiensis]